MTKLCNTTRLSAYGSLRWWGSVLLCLWAMIPATQATDWFGHERTKQACEPWPRSGSQGLPVTDMVLTWSAGLGAVWHDVYLSPDVWDVTQSKESAYRGRQLTTSLGLETLQSNTRYYWRVDGIESDGVTRHEGTVWFFETQDHGVIDPNLVAWWPCDMGSGPRLIDASGRQNHGRIMGGGQWKDGREGFALAFDGVDDAVICEHHDVPYGALPFSIALWLRPETHQGTLVWWGDAEKNRACELALEVGGVTRFSFWDNDIEFHTGSLAGEWHHLAVTFNGVDRILYHNGQRLPGMHSGANDDVPSVRATKVSLGQRSQGLGNAYAGCLDDIRLFDYAISGNRVLQLMEGDPRYAAQPIPVSGAATTSANVTELRWVSGSDSVLQDLYLGTDPAEVRWADITDSNVYQGIQTESHYPLLQALEIGQTYYWRVDSFQSDGRLLRGTLWSFSLIDINPIDDFESYTDVHPHRIFDTWIDGYTTADNGSIAGHLNEPFAETTVVYGGKQSLPFYWNNESKFTHSQVTCVYTEPQDWLRGNMNVLSLHYYGRQTNYVAGQDHLWLRIEDEQDVNDVVRYPGKATEMVVDQWHDWIIPLEQFKDVDLRLVKSLTLGIGEPNAIEKGGRGSIFVDEIQLEARPVQP